MKRRNRSQLHWRLFCILLLAVVTALVGCSSELRSERSPSDNGLPTIWVTLPPQKFIVDYLVDGQANVRVMVPPGRSPETYSPSVPQMSELARSNVYFGIGMPIERTIRENIESTMPKVRFVESAPIVTHSCSLCGTADEDVHVWLDPTWMQYFAKLVNATFQTELPSVAATNQTQLRELLKSLELLDETVRDQLAPFAGREVFINHPSLGHLTRRYGLRQTAVESDGGPPSVKRLAALIDAARAANVTAVFSQPEFGRRSVDALGDAINLEVVSLDVLSEDYINNLKSIADSIAGSFPNDDE